MRWCEFYSTPRSSGLLGHVAAVTFEETIVPSSPEHCGCMPCNFTPSERFNSPKEINRLLCGFLPKMLHLCLVWGHRKDQCQELRGKISRNNCEITRRLDYFETTNVYDKIVRCVEGSFIFADPIKTLSCCRLCLYCTIKARKLKLCFCMLFLY